MIILRNLYVLLQVGAVCLSGAAQAQEKNGDQVGLVFPAFASDGDIGHSVAHFLKLAVQAELIQEDPVTGERGYGRGISYFAQAPMSELTHQHAAALARLNGLQGTVWGYATELADGVSIEAYLTISEPFEDYRQTQQETWEIEVGGLKIDPGLPQRTIAFRPTTIPSDQISEYAAPANLRYCPASGGACRTFEDFQITRALGRISNELLVVRGGERYRVQFPEGNGVSNEVIDYATIVVAYHRGNLNQVVVAAEGFIESHLPSAATIDVNLYAVAALARMDRYAEALEFLENAHELNRFSERTLRYQVMFFLATEKYEAAEAAYEAYSAEHGSSTPFGELASLALGQLQ